MISVCTMFDSAYARKGFALLASLQRNEPDAQVFVLALDDAVQKELVLNRRFDGVKVITPLYTLESTDLLRAKESRTWAEYVWTLTPVWTLYCLENYGVDSLAYLDADCFLFDDLSPLYAETGRADVAIIPHRWSPHQKARLERNGIYNVSWVYFRNSQRALDCLIEWREQCLDWCYLRHEDGKFADQKYLDDWQRQHRAHVVENLGANLAPWSQEQYRYQLVDGHLFVSDSKREDALMFYHFHELTEQGGRVTRRTSYPLAPAVAKYVYPPYEAALRAAAWV